MTTTTTATKEDKESPSQAPPPTKSESSTLEVSATSSNATKPTTAAPPAPAVPKQSAWGSKPLNAVLAAPTPEQQAKQQQLQQNKQQQHPSQSNDQQSKSQHKKTSSHRGGKNEEKGGGQWRNNQNNQKNDGSWRNQKKGDADEGAGKGGGGAATGPGRHHHKNQNQHNKNEEGGSNNNSPDGWTRGKSLPLDLLKPNEGKDDNDKAVSRIVAEELLSLRLSFLAPPLSWESGDDDFSGPPEECRWASDTRVQEIDSATNSKRVGGDVSSKKKKKTDNETAPPLEDCKPLEVNEETRWKAGVFKKDEQGDEEIDSDETVLKKALLILNKLSLTKFDKLSDSFIECGIGRNPNCLAGAIELIIKKAQDEPHFAAMYAALCLKLSRTPVAFEEEGKRKLFKKMLLTECQKEFEQDTETKVGLATEGIEDEEERQNKANLVKKHYLGHMRFIGELYKGELINIKIMLMCLLALLEGEPGKEDHVSVDEEKVECFAKLMTVIGMILEQQTLNLQQVGKPETYDSLAYCWKLVETMAGEKKEGGPIVSNRVKFMLQDLIEMRDKGK